MERIDSPFTGIPTFLGAVHATTPEALAKAAIAVLGVPFDEGSPFLPGSRMAPRSIREHSLRFPRDVLFDPDRNERYLERELREKLIVDAGDVDIRPTNSARTFELITQGVREIVDAGALPVILGGDHSITYPAFAGIGRNAHVIHFDAHQDFDTITEEVQRTNGHSFSHIVKMEQCLSVSQIGIRGLRTIPSQFEGMKALGNRIISVSEARRLGGGGIAGLLPERSPVYVSIDVDCLDMSLVPGCVSGEPNGFFFDELMEYLYQIAQRHEVVGFDFVEVNPLLDVRTGATSYLGALIVLGFLGFICKQPWWQERLNNRNH